MTAAASLTQSEQQTVCGAMSGLFILFLLVIFLLELPAAFQSELSVLISGNNVEQTLKLSLKGKNRDCFLFFL